MRYVIKSFQDQPHPSRSFAEAHLKLRQWQQKTGENRFADITSSQTDLSDIQSSYIDTGGHFLVALDRDDSGIMGFIGLVRTLPAQADLKRFSVVPKYQGHGIGYDLCKTMVDYADDLGYAQLDLTTGQKERAQGIYKKLGFIQTATDGDDIMMTRYAKNLQPHK